MYALLLFLKRCLASLTVVFAVLGSMAFAAERPNVVIFLADDFGVGCVNANGADESLVRTPHINRLAEGGLNFVNAYTTGSVCSPTRYALLTGRYSWRTKMKSGVINSKDPLLIDGDTLTIASYLRGLGYQTAQVGKWHLGYGSERPSATSIPALLTSPKTLSFSCTSAVSQVAPPFVLF